MIPRQGKPAEIPQLKHLPDPASLSAGNLQDVERFLDLSRTILNSAGEGPTRAAFLSETSGLLLRFSGADVLELRHRDGPLRYRWRAVWQPRIAFGFRLLNESNPRTELCLPERTTLEKLCRMVLNPSLRDEAERLTPGGSFWTNDATRLPKSLTVRNSTLPQIGKPRRDCRSLAIVPFFYSTSNRGILILMSAEPDLFLPHEIGHYEGVAQTLGLAQADRHAQWALRERMKEFTCLYGIARISDRPELNRAEKLQHIADLLPPAMQHPDIAAVRIDLDESTILTSGYRAGRYRRQADIIIRNSKRGTLEVVYLEGKLEHVEGPFLPEEIRLINEVARQIARLIEREEAELQKSTLELQVRRADCLATIGQLAAGVAHELNEPLGGVLGFAQLAKKSLHDARQAERDLDKIINTVMHARDIVQKLLSYSRPSKAERAEVCLSRIAEEVLAFFETRCAKAKITIVRWLPEDLPGVLADPVEMRQVLMNLIVNAVQAMKDGGTLSVTTSCDGRNLCLTVEDTGDGMSEEIRQQIFDPFFTTKQTGQGTGLGLSVVQGIVHAHGGTISVASTLGQGTRFDVRLPIISEPPQGEV